MNYLNEHQSYPAHHSSDFVAREKNALSFHGEYPLARNSFKSFSSD